jgi:uncharacterized protein (TIGR02145 family)
MKTLIIIVLICMFSIPGFSQGEWNIWYFGESAGLDFNSGIPVPLTDCSSWFHGYYYSVSVSDSLGNLLFYSDGTYVFNKIHEVMPDGNTLDADGEQAVFGFRKPGSDHIYYLFTMDALTTSMGLRYVIIDMTMNGGLGGLQNGWIPISIPGGEETMDALTGIRHSNNKDVWIVARQQDTSYNYLSYLVTSEGLDTIPVESLSLFQSPSVISSYIRLIRISPDGTKLIANYGNCFEYCQFNPTTGQITPYFYFNSAGIGGGGGGAEFSVDSRYLYVQANGDPTRNIYQYDATKTDSATFMQSEVLISSALYASSAIMMAPDGKIYITKELKDSLCVIHNPSEPGFSCNFENNAVFLEGMLCWYGLPQFLQTYYVYIHGANKCEGAPISFSASIWPQYDSLAWDFGDPSSGPNNYSNLESPEHTYQTAGIYTVRLITHHIDNRFDTGWLTVQVYAPPTPALGPDTTICAGDSVTFDAGPCTGCTFSWDNLTTSQMNIATGQTFTTGDEAEYAVAVISPENCIGRDTVQLTVVSEAQVIVNPPSSAICSGDTVTLLLQSNPPGATFSWSAAASSPLLSGYSGGTGDTIHQVLINNDTISQTVIYTISPQVSNCPFTPLVYPVTVFPLPDLIVNPPTLEVCSGQPVVISLSSQVPGTGFSWTAEGSSANVSGFSGGFGPQINQVLINSGQDTAWVTYHITPFTTDCIGLTYDYYVSVIPTVEVTITPPFLEICSGDTAAINLNCNITGCNLSWIATASSPNITGYSNGSGNIILQQLINSDTTLQSVTYTITPSVMGCGSDTIGYVVPVHPLLPVSITISPSVNPICEGLPITFTATPTNGGNSPTYQWQVNGINAGTNSPIFSYVPSTNDHVLCTLTSSEPCTSSNPVSSYPVIVTVIEAPEVTFIPCFDTITATNAKPIRLRGGIPLGGVYSGPGVSNGYFYPSVAGPGNHLITYTYTNTALCTASRYSLLVARLASPYECGESFIDVRDSTVYSTIQIGSQCWFAENLIYGGEIPLTAPQRDNCIPEKYENPAASNEQRATSYQWDELMTYTDSEESQGLCPPGWHVPSESDWQTLFSNWTNNAFAGAPLKYTGYSGFNAFLNGAVFFNRDWYYPVFATFFWSSTPHGPYKAWAHGMNKYNYSVSFYPAFRANAFSVRCLRD